MKNCKQIATEWGLSERTVNDLCKKNKIDGAIKVGKMWKIPDDAKKPIDGRITSGKYVRHSAGVTRKPLPIGISDYVRAQADYYYVDKTMLIKEFLDQKPLVSLFTRPRRFGKTLNMDMLRVFFEISEENTSKYFEDKAIWQCGEEYRNQQGQYPVVFLTFKDVKFDSWKATLDKIRDLLQEEFGRHQELATSERIAEYEKTYFAKIINGDASEVDLTASLAKLSQMLTKHYGKAPIIIIDEYDTPIQEGYSKDFYDEIIGFMRNFFSGAFKDNKNLTYGFLTGILRIAQESIFSGLNNLTVNSVMDEEYDQFFGFTVSEVREMLKYYGVLDKEEELKDWYDGYLFGSTEIYNPWSVINYISRGCIPQAYWVNTGKNEILEDVLKVATEDITERLYSLLQGERVIARIDQNVVYRSLSEDPANIYSLLLVAGYLKTPKKELQADGSYLCEVSIPNREIAAVYKSEVLSHLLQIGAITRTTANKIAESLYANDYKNLQKAIAEYMDKSVSFYDAGAEGFYHGLVLGLIALMDNQYKIKSNRESGDGRYDIGLFPREDRYPGTVDNPYFHVVKVFNEDYVNSYLFQGDEFLDDSFQVFLKSDKCDSLAAQIERMLEELQDLINNIDAIHNLRTFLPQYTAAVKASDGTVSRRGGVAEFVNGNGGGFNHYSELKAYKPFYSRDLPSVAKWAKWRNDGIKQMCGNDCPFCTNILPSSIRSQNEIISKVFKNSALSVANAVLEYVQQAVDQGYILPDELKNEGITDVVILTCKSEFKSILKENSDNGTFKKKVFTTCRKFKGLEADAIILIDVDEDTFGSEAVQRFYVGASRARLRLEIVTTMTDENCEKVLREVVDYKKKIKNAKRELALAFNAMPIIE